MYTSCIYSLVDGISPSLSLSRTDSDASWSDDVMPFSAHRSSFPTQQVLLQICCTFCVYTSVRVARTHEPMQFGRPQRVPNNYGSGCFLCDDKLAPFILTAGADTPIIYTHAGLDIVTFLPPSLIPLSLLSFCPSSSSLLSPA